MSNQLKAKIFSNIILIFVLIILQVSMVFAWFTVENELKIYQEIIVGEFLIDLNVNSKTTGDVYTGKDVNLTNSFPMTKVQAEQGASNIFIAKIKNNGNISAMFRFKIAILNGAAYAQYLKFSAYIKNGGELDSENHTNDELTFATSGSFTDINTLLNDVTCLNNSYTDYGLIAGRTILKDGEAKYIKLYFWIDEATKMGDAGSAVNTGFGNEVLNFSFNLTVETIQSSGASWQDFTING